MKVTRFVNAVKDGPGPRVHHIREKIARIRSLPHFALPTATVGAATMLALNDAHGSIVLPDWPARESADPPPDFTVDGWRWPDGSSLIVMLGQVTELLTSEGVRVDPAAFCLLVSGWPLQLTLFDTPSLTPSAASLYGYLGETLHLSIIIHAPTRQQRDQLLASVLTLQLDPVSA